MPRSTVYRLPSTSRRSRAAFTLIELLVAITIIGILAALALGGMYRANVAARQANTKTTINKVATQINEIWESYRTRKLPINPQLVLSGQAPYVAQFAPASAWVQYFSQIRVAYGAPAIYPDLNGPPALGGINPQNNLHIAAVRLAATRELMRLELPCRFSDFTSDYTKLPTNPTDNLPPPVQTLLIPQPMNGATPLANPGGLSEQYRQFYRAHATSANLTYESAECLYMIIKFASQNELGQKSITDDPRLVGDVDGDGMPEIQDAFNSGTFTAPPSGSPFTQHNKPIAFVRWPVGFLSDLQPGPTAAQYESGGYKTTADYAGARHDIFDPQRIDPRAFTITPLAFSAGADGTYDIWEHNVLPSLPSPYAIPFSTFAPFNDPYFFDGAPTKPNPLFPIVPNAGDLNPSPAVDYPLPGAVMDRNTQWPSATGSGGYADNITNHLLSTRLQ